MNRKNFIAVHSFIQAFLWELFTLLLFCIDTLFTQDKKANAKIQQLNKYETLNEDCKGGTEKA